MSDGELDRIKTEPSNSRSDYGLEYNEPKNQIDFKRFQNVCGDFKYRLKTDIAHLPQMHLVNA